MTAKVYGISPMFVESAITLRGFNLKDWQSSRHGRADAVSGNRRIRRSLRVLVVDDDKNTADAAVWLVRCWGHTGYSARTSVAALQIADVQHPDVVLIDTENPFTDAFHLAQQLRRKHLKTNCFIVAYAEQADDSLRRLCTRCGIDLLLVKPVDPVLLEVLLLLECERVHRSRTANKDATSASATIQCIRPLTNELGNPRSHRETGGFPC